MLPATHTLNQAWPFARVLQLYRFPPFDMHGGTMRLLSSIEGTRSLGAVSVHWFDADASRWTSIGIAGIGKADPRGTPAAAHFGLKRRLFPSTLYESGRKSVRAALALMERVEPREGDLVVLHTTYLAPLIPRITNLGARVAVDVHDLVWRAHQIDARAAKFPLTSIRAAYATSIRLREESLLRRADALAVAGYADYARLQDIGISAHWVPSSLEANTVEPPPGEPIRVGLIGNFDHSATRDSAHQLLNSPLARTPEVRLVFAGLGFDALDSRPGVDVLGPVGSIDEFYRSVHCVVVPVASGSGMKGKLAEAALAGRAVITTSAGAEGYPPELRKFFLVRDDISSVTPAWLSAVIREHDAATTRIAFEAVVGPRAVAPRYAAALVGGDATRPSGRSG